MIHNIHNINTKFDSNDQINQMSVTICESRESETIVQLLPSGVLKKNVKRLLWNGEIWGFYILEDQVVAETIDNEILTNIFV